MAMQVKNQGTGFYDQYSALVYPDGTLQFITQENAFTLDVLPWASIPRMDSTPMTVMNLPILFAMPHGTYWVYNLLVPAGTGDIFTNMDNWILNYTSFIVE